MNVLVTGADGFIGKNLVERLNLQKDIKVYKFDKENSINELKESLKEIDFIFHLAGVNRPQNIDEFYTGNRDFTEDLIKIIEDNNFKIPILISSSIQAEKDNDYGKSKLAAEELLVNYSKKNNVSVFIYRLPNVFGKWCRPNYNSVIATWCYNIANSLEVSISDENNILKLVYIDDVINCFISELNNKVENYSYCSVPIVYEKTLGEILKLLISFKDSRDNLLIENIGFGFERVLYTTYLSYMPKNQFSYSIPSHSDERGRFIEIFKTFGCGQFSISFSKQGITRGNHYHHTKNEKFLVIKGKALIRFRNILETEIIEYNVSDEKMEIVDIPPGYAHNIRNTGSDEMILVVWANEIFDKNNPDTYNLEV